MADPLLATDDVEVSAAAVEVEEAKDPAIDDARSRLASIVDQVEGCIDELATSPEVHELVSNHVLTAETLLESLLIMIDFGDEVEPPAWAAETRAAVDGFEVRISAIRELLKGAADDTKDQERLAALRAISEALAFPKDGPKVDLGDPSSPRCLIHQGELLKKGTKSFFRRDIARVMMLFDDVLVMADKGGSPRRPAAVQAVLFLKGVVVVDLASSEDVGEHAFQLNDSAGRSFVLVAPDAEAKQEWLQKLTRCLVNARVEERRGEEGEDEAGGGGGQVDGHRMSIRSMQHHLVQGTLHSAAMLGRTDILTQLLAKDGLTDRALNALDEGGMAPVHLAAHGGHATAVEMLLGAGASVDAPDDTERQLTALHIAVVNGCSARTETDASAAARFEGVVSTLLQRGADVNCIDIRNQTPLQTAISAFAAADVVRAEVRRIAVHLLKAGARVDMKDDSGASLLQLIVLTALENESGDGNAAAMAAATVLDKGAEVDARTPTDRRTVLHLVCSATVPIPRLLEVLLRYGARPNARDKSGATCLTLLAINAPAGAPSPALQLAVDTLCAHGARWEVAIRFQSELVEIADASAATWSYNAGGSGGAPSSSGDSPSAGHLTAEGVTISHAAALAATKDLRDRANYSRGESDAWTRAAPPQQAQRWAMILSGGIAVDWADDTSSTSCVLCAIKFSFMKRRHHCRKCGVLCCHECSSKTFPLAVKDSKDQSKLQRACDGCFNRLVTDTYRFSGQVPAAISGMDAKKSGGGGGGGSGGGSASGGGASGGGGAPSIPARPKAKTAPKRGRWHEPLRAQEWKTRLTMFYEQNCPNKLRDIPTILRKYKGQEPVMFTRVAEKYKVNLRMWEDENGWSPHAEEIKVPLADAAAQRRALLGGGGAPADDPSRAGKKTMAALGEARNALVDRGERINQMGACTISAHARAAFVASRTHSHTHTHTHTHTLPPFLPPANSRHVAVPRRECRQVP